MSARRRRRRRRPGKSGSGNAQNTKNNRSRNNRRSAGRKRQGAGFWGDTSKLPDARSDVRITDDPAVVPRSLGEPPLPGHEKIAEHYFAAVYDRAVQTAGALAAAGGLIDPDELNEELGEH